MRAPVAGAVVVGIVGASLLFQVTDTAGRGELAELIPSRFRGNGAFVFLPLGVQLLLATGWTILLRSRSSRISLAVYPLVVLAGFALGALLTGWLLHGGPGVLFFPAFFITMLAPPTALFAFLIDRSWGTAAVVLAGVVIATTVLLPFVAVDGSLAIGTSRQLLLDLAFQHGPVLLWVTGGALTIVSAARQRTRLAAAVPLLALVAGSLLWLLTFPVIGG